MAQPITHPTGTGLREPPDGRPHGAGRAHVGVVPRPVASTGSSGWRASTGRLVLVLAGVHRADPAAHRRGDARAARRSGGDRPDDHHQVRAHRFLGGSPSSSCSRSMASRESTLGVGSALLLLYSGVSFTRRLQKMYRAAWDQQKAGVRGNLFAALALFVLLVEVLLVYGIMSVVHRLPADWLFALPITILTGLVPWTSVPYLLMDRPPWRQPWRNPHSRSPWPHGGVAPRICRPGAAMRWPSCSPWGATAAVLGLAVGWPLHALLDGGTLGQVLLLSLIVGVALLGLWRLWPLWWGIERDGGSLSRTRGGPCRDLNMALGAGCSWPASWARWRSRRCCSRGRDFPAPSPGPGQGCWPWFPPPCMSCCNVRPRHGRCRSSTSACSTMPMSTPSTPPDSAKSPWRTRSMPRPAAAGSSTRLPAGGRRRSPGTARPEQRDQRALPLLAAVLPDLRLLRALIARGVDVNARARRHDAAAGRHPRQLARPPRGGDDPAGERRRPARRRRRGQYRRCTTPRAAPTRAWPRCCATPRPNSRPLNRDGVSPLGMACAAGNWRARALPARTRRAARARRTGSPVLLAAAGTEDDDPAGVQLLLKHKARVDARDRQGRTRPARGRACRPRATSCAALLEAGADAARARRAGPHAADGRRARRACRRGRGPAAPARRRRAPCGAPADADAVPAAWPASAAARRRARRAPLGAGRGCRAGGRRGQARGRPRRRSRALVAGRRARPGLSRCPPPCARTTTRPLPDRTPLALLREGLLDGAARPGLAPRAPALAGRPRAACCTTTRSCVDPRASNWLLRARRRPLRARRPGGRRRCSCCSARGPAALPALRRAAAMRAHRRPARGGLARFLAACASAPRPPAARGWRSNCSNAARIRSAPRAAGDPPMTLAVRLGWPRLLDRLLQAGAGLDAATATA